MLERGREMVSFSYEHLVPIRHYVHQHPELSGQEYQTTAYLKAYLEKLGVRILNSGLKTCLLYTSPSPRDRQKSRMPSSA